MGKRLWHVGLFAVPVIALLLGCCGFPLYWFNHQRMQDRPELLHPYYKARLQDYGHRLKAGEVVSVEGRGYGIPQYLIDHGARYCTKHGDCYCISFGFIADSAIPELWYSPRGFEPMPEELARMNRGWPRHRWIPLAPQWAACYR